MKSEILRDEIIFKIKDCKSIINDYDNYKYREFNDGLDVDEDFEHDHQHSLHNIQSEIKELFTLLYKNSLTDNFYFFDCPLQVYKNNYKGRLDEFIKIHIDAEEIDFLKGEIEALHLLESHRNLENELLNGNYNEFIYGDLKFEITLNKKKEYISNKLLEFGWKFEQLPDESVMVRYDEYEMQPGGFMSTKLDSQKATSSSNLNCVNDFTFDKDKSLEHNLSKLTIFPTVTYENGEINKISVGIILNQKFITDISELKSIIIEKIFSEIKTLESNYKYIFASKLYSNLKWKIEALHKQINLVKDNVLKADDYVIDILTLSLSLNEEIYIILENIIALEDVSSVDKKKPNINIDTIIESNINNDTNIEPTPVNKDKPIHPIFLNEESYNLFISIVEYLNISISNIAKRGNQARFHAIWEVSDCKKKIFKPLIPLEDYTLFLNKTYKTQYKSKSFSDGSKYHTTIKSFVTLKC